MNNKKNKKLKNKYVTVEDINKLLDLIQFINFKAETAHARIKEMNHYPDEIKLNTGVHDDIEELKNKLKNTYCILPINNNHTPS